MEFSAGLVCFTYARQQWSVQILTTIFTSVTSSALLAVALWFAGERWAFSKTKGSKWLWDIVDEVFVKFGRATGLTWVKRVPSVYAERAASWSGETLTKATSHVNRVIEKVLPKKNGSISADGSSRCGDTDDFHAVDPRGGVLPLTLSPKHARKTSFSEGPHPGDSPISPYAVSHTSPILEDRPYTASPIQEFPPDVSSPSKGKINFRQAVMKVVKSQKLMFSKYLLG